MKKIFLLFSMLCLVALFPGCFAMTKPAPTVPPEELTLQKIHYTDVKESVVFDRSLEWMVRIFTDSTQVIELKDKATGKIIGKGLTEFYNGNTPISCRFTLMIEIKDDRYRATYSNFTGLWGYSRNVPRPLWHPNHISEVKEKLNALDDSLYSYISKIRTESDW